MSGRHWIAPRPHTAAGVDYGVQPERTSLAWTRTWLALLTVSAVFLRWMPHYGPAMLVLPALTMAAALLIGISQQHRIHQDVQGIHQERLHADLVPPLLLLLLLLGLGVTGIWFVLVAP